MSGPVTPFKSPNDGKQIKHGDSSHDAERDQIAGKALFTSPVLQKLVPSRRLEPVEEAEPTLDSTPHDDAVGKSPTAELFATPPLHMRWKRPRQQGGSASTYAAGTLPSRDVTEHQILDAARSPQASHMWLSEMPQRDLFSTPDDQTASKTRRKVLDFGALVVEGLRVQDQLASEDTGTLSDTESDEEPVRMGVPELACQGPLRWAAGEDKNLARLVGLYADVPREEAGEDTKVSMEKELYELLSKRSPVATSSSLGL